jgi:hypothetical protein
MSAGQRGISVYFSSILSSNCHPLNPPGEQIALFSEVGIYGLIFAMILAQSM